MPGKQSKLSQKKVESGKEIVLVDNIYNEFPVNSEVRVKGFEEDIGIGIVQGGYNLGGQIQPLVRFKINEMTKKGEKYFTSKMCLTKRTSYSCLYVINRDELSVRQNGSKAKVPKEPKQKARRKPKATS